MKTHTLARKIAQEIFDAGSGPLPCRRIQFMGGKYFDKDQPQGGFCFGALVRCIEEALLKYDK